VGLAPRRVRKVDSGLNAVRECGLEESAFCRLKLHLPSLNRSAGLLEGLLTGVI